MASSVRKRKRDDNLIVNVIIVERAQFVAGLGRGKKKPKGGVVLGASTHSRIRGRGEVIYVL